MASVFLSHSQDDKPFARRLAADLRNAGHSVWIDEAEINIGDSLIAKISAGLDQVDFVAAVLSRSSIESEWVSKELEIASNREIKEKRVVVLPLLIQDVHLPGFLQGKRYGDFRHEDQYQDNFKLLLRTLGPVEAPPAVEPDELARIREELEHVRQRAAALEAEARRAGEAAFQEKSEALKAAIAEANEKFPQHAPINRTYAFEVGHIPITLDYAMWAIAKAERRGGHPLDFLLTVENRWPDLERMLTAYIDMAERQQQS